MEMFRNGIPVAQETGRPTLTLLLPTNDEIRQRWDQIVHSPNPALVLTEMYNELLTSTMRIFFPAIGAKVIGSVRQSAHAEPEILIEGWFNKKDYQALGASFPTLGGGQPQRAPQKRPSNKKSFAQPGTLNWRQKAKLKEAAQIAAKQAGKNGSRKTASKKATTKKKQAPRAQAGAGPQ